MHELLNFSHKTKKAATMELNETRKVSIVEDVDGKKTVVIHDIRFKGRQRIDWQDVEDYIKKYVGLNFMNIEYNEKIFIGRDLPTEYSGSKCTMSLKGAIAKVKANVATGIPELIETATNMQHKPNYKEKHVTRAKKGWYKYLVRFAMPVYSCEGNLSYYNVWNAFLLVNQTASEKKYLYDIVDIKKETGNPR